MKFLVCEYSIEVEADDADEAMSKAATLQASVHSEAWSPFEVEEQEG